MKVFGREKEKKQIEKLLASDRPEFIAVYGRRRVGKTYMIRELYGKIFAFEASGVLEGTAEEQLSAFTHSLRSFGYKDKKPAKWLDAFYALEQLLQKKVNRKKPCIIFLDEMPCMDTPRSGFIHALDYFWNNWASRYSNVKLIVCGSATSWMIKNIINNYGGLHNRLTYHIHLYPFNLKQTEQFLKKQHFDWDRLTVLQLYMITGGVPFYLSMLQSDQSLVQNTDRLFFNKDAQLKGEFERLYKSLFKTPDPYLRIVKALAQSNSGLTQKQIQTNLQLPKGGHLSEQLEALVQCDFIRRYDVIDKKISTRQGIYQLTDMFTLFHYRFLASQHKDGYWQSIIGKPRHNAWLGIAFEKVVAAHIDQIKAALGISGIYTEYYSWRSRKSEPGAQIDLLIERADKVIHLCEIKYSETAYTVSKSEDALLRNRVAAFKSETGTSATIQPAFITTLGLKKNTYSSQLLYNIKLDDLFAL